MFEIIQISIDNYSALRYNKYIVKGVINVKRKKKPKKLEYQTAKLLLVVAILQVIEKLIDLVIKLLSK